MKLIVSKLPYWPVRIAIENRKSSKAIVSVPTLVYRSTDLLPCNLPVSLNLPCICHSTTPSTKWFPLECAYCSMVFIALVYNSGSQNILINDWYACWHVLSKLLTVWNAQFVCWGLTTIIIVQFFPLILPCTGIEGIIFAVPGFLEIRIQSF